MNPAMNPVMNPAIQNQATIKEDLIIKIQKYQASKRFGETIKKDLKISYTRESLSRMNVDKLDTILHRIRSHLNSRNLDGVFQHMASTCAITYEKTLTPFYNIDGFSSILLNNPEFWDCLERWKIERKMPNIPPHLQMLYIIASTTITAHELNKLNNIQQSHNDIVIKDNDDLNKKEKTTYELGKKI